MNSAISARVQAWCLKPSNLWDCEITNLLVRREWGAMRERFSWNPDDYNTAGYILNDPTFVASKTPISKWIDENRIYLEAPCQGELGLFYKENGLFPVENDELQLIAAVEKLDDALKLLDTVPGLVDCVAQLVRVISVLKLANPDADVSYSHPVVPFSIFVSVCNERSIEASARVAESILHEAMHLQLSLIQKVVSLIDLGTHDRAQYFSPWRQQERPANGVLHAIYVFRTVLEFFRRLASDHLDENVVKHSEHRVQEISCQLAQVQDFYRSPALNATGAELARQLVHI